VLVHEFPQWLPRIGRAVPHARLMVWGGADSFIENDGMLPYLRRADALIGATETLARRFAERVPELADRCYVVYSGVDIARFRPGDGRLENRILYAGRITPEKGVHVLVDAFRILADSRPELELVLAGPPWVSDPSLLHGSVPQHLDEVTRLATPEYGAELMRRAGPHAHRVSMPGMLGGEDLVKALQDATVVCHPGLCEEGFGGIVAEALACGAPVVVSDLGGPPEYIEDRSSGIVVAAGHVERLAEALAELLDGPELRAEMGRRARALAEDRLAAAGGAEALAAVLDGTATPVTAT
jgi:glycosyltransferase involved in cell wall biosynthesis